MSKKSLLNESTVRRFMKYANIGHLSENFIGEGDGFEEEEEELDLGAEEGPAPAMGDMGDEAPEAPEAPEGDMGDMGAEIEMSPEDALALVQGLASEISDLTGHEVTASADEGGEEAPEGDMGDEAPMGDMGGEEAPMGDMGGEEAPAEDEEGVLEGVDMIDDEEVVTETLRRVTRRIKGMQKRDRLAETVTNRIMKRLRKNK